MTTKGFWMSLSVSGVTPVFFTRSSQEEKSKRPSSTNWLLVSPMLEKIPTPTESEVSLLRSLMSCGPIPLVKVRPPEALVVPPSSAASGSWETDCI